MNFPWREYLTVAEALIRARNTFAPLEARYRAAVSRPYYVAYCAARNHARDYEDYMPSPAARDHDLVRNYYQEGASRTHHKIGQFLHRLRIDRHHADYEVTSTKIYYQLQRTPTLQGQLLRINRPGS